MNLGSDPADQVVRYTLEGTEFALRISGTAAKNFAIFAAAVLRDQKKTRGKTNLTRLLREGKPLKFFSVSADRMREFAQEAKRHGLLLSDARPQRSGSYRDRHLGRRFRQSGADYRADAVGCGGDRRGPRLCRMSNPNSPRRSRRN